MAPWPSSREESVSARPDRCVARRLAGDPAADPAPHVAELEAALRGLRMSVAPLLHPLSPLRARRARARQVIRALDDCARQARGLAAPAADLAASHDARLTAACARVEAAVRRLTAPVGPSAAASAPPPGRRRTRPWTGPWPICTTWRPR